MLKALALTVACATAANATTTTITFGLGGGAPYVEQGYSFDQRLVGPFTFGMVGTNGTPSFINVTRVDGAAFDVHTLQVSEANSAISPQTLNFSGVTSAGATVRQSYRTLPAFTRETVTFTALFTDLTSFVLPTRFTAFDNLVVSKSVSTVPAPTAFPLLLGAFGLAALFRAQQRKATG